MTPIDYRVQLRWEAACSLAYRETGLQSPFVEVSR
jgi:hypothetical protein